MQQPDRTSLTKRINHPAAGPLSFGIESVIGPHDAEQRLIVYTIEPDSPTERAMPFLASWSGHSDYIPNCQPHGSTTHREGS